MKKDEFERSDGSQGFVWKLDKPEDNFVCSFDEPLMTNRNGFDNYTIGIEGEGEKPEILRLTKTQFEQLKKIGNLKGKKIQTYSYSNNYGEFIGVSEKK